MNVEILIEVTGIVVAHAWVYPTDKFATPGSLNVELLSF